MKIDKDFAVKVEGRVFTANEISSVSFDIDWFKMNCVSENGTKFTVEASLKDVELLNNTCIPDLQVEEETWKSVFGNTKRWIVYEADTNTHDKNATIEDVKQAVREAINERGNEPKTATELYIETEKALRRYRAFTSSCGITTKAVKAAAEAISNFKIDEKQLSDLIKKYNQGIARSGR